MAKWDIAAFTHRGRVRAANEDAIAINGTLLLQHMTAPATFTVETTECLLAVADGLGGHGHGTFASRAALESLTSGQLTLTNEKACRAAIERANDHLYSLMERQPELSGMGTTLVGAALTESQLIIFNVGDSRAYLNTREQLIQMSSDHVLNNRIRAGRKPCGSITQAIGGSHFPVEVEPHIASDPPLTRDDTLLLCSDGLTGLISDVEIQAEIGSTKDLTRITTNLVDLALRAGGHDNISVVVARLHPRP